VTVIQADHGLRDYWRDLVAYRELFAFLAWRDLAVRYKQTVIGVAWSVIRPLLTMIVFTLVFGSIANLPSGDAPYPVLVFAAMLPWQFFSTGLVESSGSLVANANMITKVYFPRLALPVASLIVALVDLLISLAILAMLMVIFGVAPTWRLAALPVLIGLAGLAALGAGVFLAALNVKYRDFRYIVPFIAQLGIYISPVGFSSDVVPEQWRLVYSLNPMVGVIDGFRWAILGGDAAIYWPGFLLSLGVVAIMLAAGLQYFRATERGFADVI
jgi:lipopolysaccharide transport system permease protein